MSLSFLKPFNGFLVFCHDLRGSACLGPHLPPHASCMFSLNGLFVLCMWKAWLHSKPLCLLFPLPGMLCSQNFPWLALSSPSWLHSQRTLPWPPNLTCSILYSLTSSCLLLSKHPMCNYLVSFFFLSRLVFYCSITNYHKLKRLKITHICHFIVLEVRNSR